MRLLTRWAGSTSEQQQPHDKMVGLITNRRLVITESLSCSKANIYWEMQLGGREKTDEGRLEGCQHVWVFPGCKTTAWVRTGAVGLAARPGTVGQTLTGGRTREPVSIHTRVDDGVREGGAMNTRNAPISRSPRILALNSYWMKKNRISRKTHVQMGHFLHARLSEHDSISKINMRVITGGML